MPTMLSTSKIVGGCLKSYLCLHIRCLSSRINVRYMKDEFPGAKLDLEDAMTKLEEKKQSFQLEFTPMMEGDLQDIHKQVVGTIETGGIAHTEYENYCKKNPENIITVQNQYDRLNNYLSPLLSMTDYSKQLKIKRSRFISPMRQLRNNMRKSGCYLRELSIKPHYMCPVQPVRYCQMIDQEYRNISEFSVHTGVDGEYNTVGYLLPNEETKESVCICPIHHPNTKKSHKLIAMFFQDFIQNNTLDLNCKPWRIWNGITIRSTEKTMEMTPQNMVIVKVSFCINARERKNIKESLVDFFFRGKFKEYSNISSLYIQFGDSPNNVELLKGNSVITDKVGKEFYEIAPYTSFPGNTKAVNVLLEAVDDAYEFDMSTVVLQMGCHSNFAMHLHRKVRTIICMEGRKSMLETGKIHAKINGYKNVSFFTFKKYEEIDEALNDPSANYVAVVHSINGYNKNILYCLRKSVAVKAVVYIFHSFENVAGDLYALCSSKILSWNSLYNEGKVPERFSPCQLIPLDMLPNTTSTEFVLTLKRESAIRRKRDTDKLDNPLDREEFYAFTEKHKLHQAYEDYSQDLDDEDD